MKGLAVDVLPLPLGTGLADDFGDLLRMVSVLDRLGEGFPLSVSPISLPLVFEPYHKYATLIIPLTRLR